ncbi:MAG TPA: response regulator transcription factor [Leptospiraceae bacterium]|nr:response regulator transcription factor [Leptospiraceae bacterium]HMY69242.1 response regulator transcription factor [Leptospiraceae bacterium]HNF15534.1 response regulator transcription factor [Leptospiraceae bacterium]HNF23907.1 response regulator transcription factor [Leptospiraceae bacterium]HNI24939.1 response regulator transcription factor [Leptospiraceae bacterium]
MNLKPPHSILIADDHEISLSGMIRLLKVKGGYYIKSVKRGDSILEEVIKHSYHLIIADYLLPGINGLDALIRIKRKNPSQKTAVLSSNEEEKIRLICEQEGIEGYIFKSESRESILNAVKKILMGETYYSSFSSPGLEFIWNHPSNPFLALSFREIEILKLFLSGRSQKTISVNLNISLKTIETHRTRINKKLGMDNNRLIEEAKNWGLL